MSKQAHAIPEDMLARIRANIFHCAHPSFEPSGAFKWHTNRNKKIDTWQRNSSQALAIDFFGTLKMIDQTSRDALMMKIAREIGLNPSGPWNIELEWEDASNRLNELRSTQVDAIATSPYCVICFEAKFQERNGGCCSQTDSSKGPAQCDGNYHMQRNPRSNELSRCALSGKGIRYWQVIPEVMFCDETVDHTPCPFRGSWYQWMRNIVLAHEKSKAERKTAAVVILYANHSSLHFPKVVQSADWRSFVSMLRSDSVIFKTRTYQDLLNMVIGLDVPASQTLIEMRSWVLRKIEAAGISAK